MSKRRNKNAMLEARARGLIIRKGAFMEWASCGKA